MKLFGILNGNIILYLTICLFIAGCPAKQDNVEELQGELSAGEAEIKEDTFEETYHAYQVELGKGLVELGGCHECHSPKIRTPEGLTPDPDRLLSGYPGYRAIPDLPYRDMATSNWENVFYTTDATVWVGKWGVSFAANITPDKETGIGNWTQEQFVNMFRNERHIGEGKGGIAPPMPIKAYAKLSSFDLRAIFVYLMSIAPVENKVPERIPPDDPLFQSTEE